MMRRRALLAARPIFEDEGLPPESTTFEFPLYLNTRIIEKTSDFLYRSRDADDISNQLLQFYSDNHIVDSGGSVSWPTDFFKNYPVFIDGYQVEDIPLFMANCAEFIRTSRDYGDYDEIDIFLDEYELWVDGRN